jgi:hypothetical protein
MTSREPGGQTLPDVSGHVRLLPPPPAERVRSERDQAPRRGPLLCRDTERADCLAPVTRWRERSDDCAQPRPPGSIRRRVDASSAVRKTRTPPVWPRLGTVSAPPTGVRRSLGALCRSVGYYSAYNARRAASSRCRRRLQGTFPLAVRRFVGVWRERRDVHRPGNALIGVHSRSPRQRCLRLTLAPTVHRTPRMCLGKSRRFCQFERASRGGAKKRTIRMVFQSAVRVPSPCRRHRTRPVRV